MTPVVWPVCLLSHPVYLINKQRNSITRMDIKSTIRTIADYPKQGIMFRDITTLLKDPNAFNECIDQFVDWGREMKPDKIVGIEARGFIFAAAIAYQLKTAFIPLRKAGKLPAETLSCSYDLEYGKDCLEVHADAIEENEKVMLVDDLIATGGTAVAAVQLIETMKATVIGCCFVVALPDLGGCQRLEKMGQKVVSLCAFDGR